MIARGGALPQTQHDKRLCCPLQALCVNPAVAALSSAARINQACTDLQRAKAAPKKQAAEASNASGQTKVIAHFLSAHRAHCGRSLSRQHGEVTFLLEIDTYSASSVWCLSPMLLQIDLGSGLGSGFKFYDF